MEVIDLVSDSDDEGINATNITPVTITTLTDHQGISLQRRGRPRSTPIRFSAVTTDPFHCFDDDGYFILLFVIRGRPAAKKRPGVGYQQWEDILRERECQSVHHKSRENG